MDIVDRFQIPILDTIALRNPQGTQLGQRIVEGAIVLIDELGFEEFNFKKLALSIGTTEASVYRWPNCCSKTQFVMCSITIGSRVCSKVAYSTIVQV